MRIQRILRHANVNITASYYIKTVDGDVRDAMEKLQDSIGSRSGLLRTAEKGNIVM